ncbi:MAG: calcium/sodium antiporter [Pseudomonadota bacterium]
MLSYLLLALGLTALILGGDWLVKASVGLAERWGIPPLIIGLTIVAFGTSAPELVISLDAALDDAGGIAVGNVVGSNIANVLLVLGVPALISRIQYQKSDIGDSIVLMTAVSVVFAWQLMNPPLTKTDGLVLIGFLVVFLGMQFYKAKAHADEAEDDYHDEIGDVPTRMPVILGFLVAGLVALPSGAHLAVTSAVDIAQQLNVSDELIGVTIIAIGTSLPELATGIMAARQNNASVGVGNVIGSNIFNLAAIMGITTLVVDIEGKAMAHIVAFDIWVMLAATALLVLIPLLKLTIGRRIGTLLLVLYVAYLTTTFLV